MHIYAPYVCIPQPPVPIPVFLAFNQDPGDFFQVDVAENFATGDRLVRQADVCTDASIRFLDFGGGTRLTIWLTNPRGTGAAKPFSFTVQA